MLHIESLIDFRVSVKIKINHDCFCDISQIQIFYDIKNFENNLIKFNMILNDINDW